MDVSRRRLKSEVRDLMELVLIPALSVIMPWSLCFRLFGYICSFNWLYQQEAERALSQAQKRGWVGDAKEWLRRRKLVTLIDHADFYLSKCRSDRWMKRYMHVQGQWPPAEQGFLAVTYHWGAGMWALRHAQAHGVTAHMLVADMNSEHFKGRWVLYTYIKARVGSISQALKLPTVDVATSLRPVVRSFKMNQPIFAVVDVPADQAVASAAVSLLDGVAQVPSGLLRLAVISKVPIVIYVNGIDLLNGKRFLTIEPIGVAVTSDEVLQQVFDTLSQHMAVEPAAWHFWSEAERFFRDSTSTP